MILVTGGCGYIGSHVVMHLTGGGEQVVVFDNLSAGRREALLHDEPLVVGDITKKDDLEDVFAANKIDVVIHLAALVNAAESVKEAEKYKEVNDTGSRNVWEVAAEHGVKHFVYASSAAVYGNMVGKEPVTENYPLAPANPYGETKLAGERSLAEVTHQTGGTYVALRFFNVAGAEASGRLGQNIKNRAIMSRLFAAAKGDVSGVVVSGSDYDTADGTVVRDFIHVEDIAAAIVKAVGYLRSGKPSEIANLGTGRATTIRELITTVERVTGKTLPITYGPRNPGDIAYSLSDSSRAMTMLGWEPERTLEDMVKSGWKRYCNVSS